MPGHSQRSFIGNKCLGVYTDKYGTCKIMPIGCPQVTVVRTVGVVVAAYELHQNH